MTMGRITLVQFFVNFLKPYADLPEFTICIAKAVEELECTIPEKSFHKESSHKESFYEECCRLDGRNANLCNE